VKLVCWLCHAVEHFGRTENMVAKGELTERAREDTINHFCRVNGVSRDEFRSHLTNAKAEWMKMSQLTWRTDFGTYEVLVEERKRAIADRKAEADHQAIVEAMGVDFDGDGPPKRKRSRGDVAGQKRRYRERQLARKGRDAPAVQAKS
jgi:hypothetical protein